MTQKPDEMDPDPEDSDFLQSWIEHPHTQSLRKTASKARQSAFEVLKGACKTSQDPKVVTAYAHWEHWLKLEQEFSGKARNA